MIHSLDCLDLAKEDEIALLYLRSLLVYDLHPSLGLVKFSMRVEGAATNIIPNLSLIKVGRAQIFHTGMLQK